MFLKIFYLCYFMIYPILFEITLVILTYIYVIIGHYKLLYLKLLYVILPQGILTSLL